jgi:XTP/dITP diphosphohydrolase
MARLFQESKLLIASHNKGKIQDLKLLLAPYPIAIVTASELNLPEPEETEDTFKGNACLKALYAAKATGLAALADDSGLVIPALNGQPGVYSSRWAGPEKDFSKAIQRIEKELQGKTDRNAYFASAIALAWPDGHVECFEEHLQGRLVFPPRGSKGFGYSPIFMPDGHTLTIGEMEPQVRNSLSHRFKAISTLVANCFKSPAYLS